MLILPAQKTDFDPTDPYSALPHGAVIGSSSVRRQAQLKHARPDLNFTLFRGNVGSRLKKIDAGEVAATLLAFAGLRRLGLEHRASLPLSTDLMVPAACQGIVGITVRESFTRLRTLLAAIEDKEALAVSQAERALLALLDGSCNTPIGAYAKILADGTLHLTGLLASTDGTFLVRGELTGAAQDAARIGTALGAQLKRDAPASIF